MRFTLFYLIFLLILILSCNKKNNENFKSKNSSSKSISRKNIEVQKNMVKKSINKNILNTSSKLDEFFKGGYKKINGENYGIYIVEKGDNVWVIAHKYAQYKYGQNCTKQDIGNIAYKINKVNFSNYFGGVNDNLKIGDKILIPLD